MYGIHIYKYMMSTYGKCRTVHWKESRTTIIHLERSILNLYIFMTCRTVLLTSCTRDLCRCLYRGSRTSAPTLTPSTFPTSFATNLSTSHRSPTPRCATPTKCRTSNSSPSTEAAAELSAATSPGTRDCSHPSRDFVFVFVYIQHHWMII